MRDDFPEDVKQALCNRVANRCSHCGTVTSGPQDDESKAVNLGVAAHITAASPRGPRYDPTLTPDERRHASNGIWLCQNHAKMIDNDARYSPTVIREWKAAAEARADREVTQGAHTRPTGLRIELPKPVNPIGYMSAGSYSVSMWRFKVRLIAQGEKPLDVLEVGLRERDVGEWMIDEVFWPGNGQATGFPIRVAPSTEFCIAATSPKPSDTKPARVGRLTLWFRDHTQLEGEAHELTIDNSVVGP